MRKPPRRTPLGFTLVELLVVIFIILLVSAVTLPTVLPALQHRQVNEAARIFQAAIAGARDAAVRSNAPRGIRLMPDPTLTQPPIGNAAGAAPGSISLAYNRIVPIEAAPDYSQGLVCIPNAAFIFFIMRMELGGLLYKFSVDRMFYLSFYSHSDRLCHFITGDNPDPCFT